MTLGERIEALITAPLLDKGIGVVRVELQGSERKTLQVMIERVDGENISMDDCVVANDIVSVLLDVEDPLSQSYTLEMTSAGLDRPLIKREDFKRFAGSRVKIELKTPFEGARRWQGILQGIEEDRVKIETSLSSKNENFRVAEFAFSDIQKAKLIPTYES